MSCFPFALQLYSVRDDMATDFEGTLRKVKAMGYDGVEFAGIFGKDPKEIKRMCSEIGLVPVSAHVPFMDMMKNPEGVISAYREIGCEQVVIPYLSAEFLPGGARYGEFRESIISSGKLCKEHGMTLAYHNHDFEFAKNDGRYLLDIMLNDIHADILKVQPDTCWVSVGGENPAEYILKYSGRISSIHYQDYTGEKSFPAKTEKDFVICPAGYGNIKAESIFTACLKAGVKWIIIEQDDPGSGASAVKCAEMSIKRLKSL